MLLFFKPTRVNFCSRYNSSLDKLGEAKTAIEFGASAIGLVARMPSGPGPISDELIKQIAANAGKEGSVIVEQLKKEKENIGYNAKTDKFEDMIAAGVIDPTKVTRSALQNAASIAGILLSTEACVAEIPEDKNKKITARFVS